MVNPVVVVPGIKGTGLENFYLVSGDTTWGAVQVVGGTALDNVLLDASGEVDFSDSVVNRPTYALSPAYKKFVEGLRSRLGTPVYIFPYDWRLSNRANGERFADFIAHLQKKPMRSVKGWAGRVNVVCHSMGGLVARSALKTWGERKQDCPIDNLVFIATPHLGSLDAIRGMVVGDVPFFDFKKELRKLARALPSVYELLPRLKNALVDDAGADLPVFKLASWQSNVSLPSDGLQDVTQKRLDAALEFLSGLPLPTDAKLGINGEALTIYGNKQGSTLGTIPVVRKLGNLTNVCAFDRATFVDGDMTVPVESAKLAGVASIEIPFSDVGLWPSEWGAHVNMHAFMCALDETQTVVSRFLTRPSSRPRTLMPLNLLHGLRTPQ